MKEERGREAQAPANSPRFGDLLRQRGGEKNGGKEETGRPDRAFSASCRVAPGKEEKKEENRTEVKKGRGKTNSSSGFPADCAGRPGKE